MALGGMLYTETYVTKVEESHSETTLTTSRGVLHARKVIFATNGYTAALLPQYEGVITPFKGQNSHLSPLPSFNPPMILDHTYNLHFSKRYANYLNPRPDNTIILGGAKWTYEHTMDRAEWWNTTHDTSLINNTATEHFDSVMANHFYGWENAKAHHIIVWTGSKKKSFFFRCLRDRLMTSIVI
jgi:glycine/D-amino acid oxidase-like deaminating enzyme